jgi:hypothetical protein
MPVVKDPRKARLILDMLSKPVDADEDEFLDKLDVKVGGAHCLDFYTDFDSSVSPGL